MSAASPVAPKGAEEAALVVGRSGYAVGDLLDVRDTVQKWMEGRVVQADPKKGYYINYVGWSEKWNEWLPIASPRLAPYRSYTTKSTAPTTNSSAYQLEGDNLLKFRSCAAKLPPVLAKAKARSEAKEPLLTPKQREQQAATHAALVSVAVAQGTPPPPEPESRTEFSETEWSYIVGELASTVTNVLGCVVHDLAVVGDAARLLNDWTTLCALLLHTERDLQPTISECLVRVLNADPSASEKRFYSKYGQAATDPADSPKGKVVWAVRPKATGSGDSLKIVSSYLIANINTFGDAGGFDSIARRIASMPDDDSSPSFVTLGHWANLLRGLENQTVLEQKFAKRYYPSLRWDGKSLLTRVSGASDDQLKLLSRDGLRSMTRHLCELVLASKEVSGAKNARDLADRVQLAVIQRLLQSDILEKRINALLDLHELVRHLRLMSGSRGVGSQPTSKQMDERNALGTACFTTPATFLDWVVQSRLLDIVLSPEAHEETLKRSGPLLRYLALNDRLPVEPIFALFDSVLGAGGAGKHEAFVRTVFDLVADLTADLSDATLDTLLQRLSSIPKANYTEMYLHFLHKFAVQCSRTNPARAETILKRFWELVSSGHADLSDEVRQTALQLLCELLAMGAFDTQRVVYAECAIKSLNAVDTPVVSVLQLLTHIISTYPSQCDPKQWSRPVLIVAMDNNLNLCSVLFKQFEAYHAQAKAKAKAAIAHLPKDEQQQPLSDVMVGRHLHSEQISARLKFLRYILYQCPKMLLPTAYLDTLWRLLYTNAVCAADQSRLFQWLGSLLETGEESGAPTRRRHFNLLGNDDSLKHIFRLLTSCVDDDALSADAYECIQLYFCYVNFLQGCLAYPARCWLQLLSFDGLLGIDALWQMAATATQKKVIIYSRFLIVDLYTKLDPKLSGRRAEYTRLFLDRCLDALRMHGQALVAGQDQSYNLRVSLQLLSLLDAFLLACDKQQHAEEAATNGAAAGSAASSPSNAAESSNQSAAPSGASPHRALLSNHQPYFALLFELLSLGGEVASRVWNLLVKLPTNADMHNKIAQLPETAAMAVAAAAKAGQPAPAIDWAALLSGNSTVKLLYALQLVHSHLRVSDDDDAAHMSAIDAWSLVFLQGGGFAYVLSLLLSWSMDAMVAEDALSQQCAGSVLRLLTTFMQFAPGSPPARLTDAIIPYDALIRTLLDMLQRAVRATHVDRDMEHHAAVAHESDPAARKPRGLVMYAFQLMSLCLHRLPAESPLLQLVQSFHGWDEILQSGLLDHPSTFLRDQVAQGIELLCSESDLTPTADAPPAAPVARHLTSFFLPKLLSLLPHIDTRSRQCACFFSVTAFLLHAASEHEVSFDYASLATHLMAQLQRHPILESRSSDRDDVLVGYLQLTAELLRQQPQLKSDAQSLVQHVFDCLFTLPATRDPAQEEPEAAAAAAMSLPPPKCKSAPSRRAAFELLAVLVHECAPNLLLLSRLLLPLHRVTHSDGAQPDEWEFEAKSDEKSECGYVGLRNLGAVCYANSTIQQFFMHPEFRRQLLAAQAPASDQTPPHQSVLFQLQSIMAFLQESEKQAFDPQGLCKSFTDFDGNPINVGVQEDAASFVTRLLDKIVESSKGSPGGALLKSAVYGQTVDQFIGHPPRCTHSRERAEEFATVGLSVRHSSSLQDSLRSFVQGEDMTGKNAYKCAACDAKVDTTKRTVFKTLPPLLIFNLKRFELNYETMRTFKINDRLEFPMLLNMKPYSKEGIAEMERAAKGAVGTSGPGGEADADAAPEHGDDYYEYELSGVTVHTGSMDRGHYYSFIQEPPTAEQMERGESGRWLEFNDTIVRPFDPRSIPDECFGGHERIQQFASNGRATEQTVEKQRNAYLLFYTRRKAAVAPAVAVTAGDAAPTTSAAKAADASAAAAPSPSLSHPLTRRKAPIPSSIFQSVCHSNLVYWRDRYVFDEMYHEFLFAVMQSAFAWLHAQQSQREGEAHTNGADNRLLESPIPADLQEVHTAVTELSTRFVMETLSRCHHKQRLGEWGDLLRGAYRRGPTACRWLLHTISHNVWSQQLLLSCPLPQVRQIVAALLIDVIRITAPAEHALMRQRAQLPVLPTPAAAPEASSVADAAVPPPADGAYVCAFVDSLVELLRVVPEWWRRFNQFFSVLASFSQSDIGAPAYLLRRHNLLARLCDLYLGDGSPLADNPFHMPAPGGKRVQVGDTLVRPDTTAFLHLLSRLVCASTPLQPSIEPPTRLSPEPLLALSPEAWCLVFSQPFLARLITDATSRRRGEHVRTLLTHLCWENLELSHQLISLIDAGIRAEQVDTLRPYIRVISALMQVDDSLQAERQDSMMAALLTVMEAHAGYWSPMNFLLDHLLRLCKQQPAALRWLHRHPSKVEWLQQWLRAHPAPPRQGEATLMHKPRRVDPATQLTHFEHNDFLAFAPRCFPSLSYSTAHKAAALERLRAGGSVDTRGGDTDSDEELVERTFAVGEHADVLDPAGKWMVGRVEALADAGRTVWIHYDGWASKFDEPIAADSIRITRLGRFTNGIVREQQSSPRDEATPAGAAVDEIAAGVSTVNLR